MRCPICQNDDTRVVDSRTARQGRAIRRRRSCAACGNRFTTYEIIEATRPNVLKSDGKTEPFEPGKLLRSLRLACNKRPIDLALLQEFVESLDAQFSVGGQRTITTSTIGDSTLAFLRDLDNVAYVRYASVYRSFDDIVEFLEELQRIQSEDTSTE